MLSGVLFTVIVTADDESQGHICVRHPFFLKTKKQYCQYINIFQSLITVIAQYVVI